jgi:putative phage-type endonuclease
MSLTKEQILQRKTFIGGSDAAAVLGLSRWKTPVEVWAEKTGLIEAEDISDKLPVKLGNIFEETVAQLFCEETGKKVQRANETIFHKHYPFIGANIDRKVIGEDSILEVKTCSAWKAKEWQDEEEIPQEYILQVMHYLAVTGKAKAYLAVLIGNQDFKVKEILRDEAMINQIITKEAAFWNEFVLTKIMPTTIKAQDGDILNKLFPHAEEGKEIQLEESVNMIIDDIEAYSKDEKAIKSQINKLRNELKAKIRENETGITSLYKIKWKNIHKDSYVMAEQNYRQIFVKKLAEKE